MNKMATSYSDEFVGCRFHSVDEGMPFRRIHPGLATQRLHYTEVVSFLLNMFLPSMITITRLPNPEKMQIAIWI